MLSPRPLPEIAFHVGRARASARSSKARQRSASSTYSWKRKRREVCSIDCFKKRIAAHGSLR